MSLYKRLHEANNDDLPAGAGLETGRVNPALEELRHRVHSALIEELGPILYDQRMGEDELRKKVHEALHAANCHGAHAARRSRQGPADPGCL